MAVYSGNSNNNRETSSCEFLPINIAGASIMTARSASTITNGQSVTDSAILSGTISSLSGTVTYEYFSGSYCYGAGNLVGIFPVTDGVATPSTPLQFDSAGSYSWNAVFNGASYPVTSQCESLIVTGSVITTSLSATSINVGGSVFDTSTLTGITSTTSTSTTSTSTTSTSTTSTSTTSTSTTSTSTTSTAGSTVQYQYFGPGNSACSGSGTAILVFVTNGVVPDSASQQFDTPGQYSWNAVYTSGLTSATSECEPLNVDSLTTSSLSSSLVITGGSITDIATLNGGASPTGTVTFNVYSGSTSAVCTGTPTATFTVEISATTSSSTATIAGLSGGPYEVQAAYTGDANNAAATSPCGSESFTVSQAPTTVATALGAMSPLALGAIEYDTATISGAVTGFTPTGTVTYHFFHDGTCGLTPGSAADEVTTGGWPYQAHPNPDGLVPNSQSTGPLGAGSYSFSAEYSEDSNYAYAASVVCEPFAVTQVTLTISTTLVTVGTAEYDTATISGAVTGFTPTGTITYHFFQDGTCGAPDEMTGGGWPYPVHLNLDGSVPNSQSTGPLGAGSYSFQAFYSGDANYESLTSLCEPDPAITTTTTLTSSAVTVGGSAADLASNLGASFSYAMFSLPSVSSGALGTTGVWHFKLQVTDRSAWTSAYASVAMTIDSSDN